MRKLGWAALVGVSVLAGAATALAFVGFDAPALGQALLARVEAATGARISARTFRLRLLRGLSLGDVRADAAFEGGRAEIALDALVFDHRLWPLLRRRLVVDRIVLEKPRLVLSEGSRPQAREATAGAAAGGLGALALFVSAIDVEDGSVVFAARAGPPPLSVTGLDIRLRDLLFDPAAASPMHALTGTGEVRIREVALPSRRAREAEGRLRLAGGRLLADDIRFHADEGRFQARLTVSLERLPLAYTLWLKGDPLDVNALAGTKGGAFGPGRFELDATGAGPDPEALEGKGSLWLAAGRLPSTPILEALGAALGRRLADARYRATQAPFRVQDGKVFLDGLRVDAEEVTLDVSGWTSLAGALDLAVTVRTPREGLRPPGVPEGLLDALTGDDGRVSLPVRVTGTQAQPRVVPDANALRAQAGRAAGRSLLDKAGRALGGLFRKGRE